MPAGDGGQGEDILADRLERALRNARVCPCGNETEAVVGGKSGMATLHRERLTDLLRRQVVRDHAGLVERMPFGLGKIEHFEGPHGQRDHESIGQIANDAQQTPLRRPIRHEASLTMTQVTGCQDH